MSNSTTMNRLYTGEGGVDFIGRRKLWYSIAAAIVALSILVIAVRGFTLGIDFEGGTKMSMPAAELSTEQVQETFAEATGIEPQSVQIVGAGDSRILEIQSTKLSDDQIDQARNQLFEKYQPKDAEGTPSPDAVGDSTVSESWGSTITKRMVMAMGAFLILVFIYIAIRFERDMSIAAIGALLIDAIVIAGTYALIGFEVTPATVIGFLTVLSFSLYDTVVVFDKVKENTAGFENSTRRTYAEQANLAVNQTVMRSISTTVISALPIFALMVVAVWMMGVGTLKDLALVQLIGIIQGTFSSVMLATPFLVSLKNRRKAVREHNARVAVVRAGEPDPADEVAVKKPVKAAAPRATYSEPEAGNAVKAERPTTWRPGQG